jgi:hypothetical protein
MFGGKVGFMLPVGNNSLTKYLDWNKELCIMATMAILKNQFKVRIGYNLPSYGGFMLRITEVYKGIVQLLQDGKSGMM